MLSDGCVKQPFTRRQALGLAFSALAARFAYANDGSEFTRDIPSRSLDALTGSRFAELVANMDRHEREQVILAELCSGNLPSFLRRLVSIELGSSVGRATIFIMPEYLAIGSDSDFLRIPMNFHTAATVADRLGFVLPTKRIVDAIYDQSACRFVPQPLPAGPQMTSTKYYSTHNQMIDAQAKSRNFSAGALVAGHKKDVVLTNRLSRNPGKIAIYGWHRAPGMPIQPLSTVHGANYADYSHGIRLVARKALIDGKLRPVSEILEDTALATALSDEGPIGIDSLLASV